MKLVHAVIVDREWFQVYDNNNKFTEDYVASGMYWNYFYNVWKTVSFSPFSNMVAVTVGRQDAIFNVPDSINMVISNIEDYDKGKIFTLETDRNVHHLQTEALTKNGVAVHPYGAYIVPDGAFTDTVPITVKHNVGNNTANYTGAITLNPLVAVGTEITLTKQV